MHGIKDKQWDVKILNEFQGVPWEPIPGREGIEVRANIELPMAETEPTRVQEPEPKEERVQIHSRKKERAPKEGQGKTRG